MIDHASVYTASQQQVEAEPCIKYIAMHMHMGHTSDIIAIMYHMQVVQPLYLYNFFLF